MEYGKSALNPHFRSTVIEDVLQNAFFGLWYYGVEFYPGNKNGDSEYADNIALIHYNAQASQQALDRLFRYDMGLAPPKCTAFLQG